MSKKMLKRSLALGALMAFVITGSAMAASGVIADKIVNGTISGTGTLNVTVSGEQQGLQLGLSNGSLSEKVTISGFDSIVLDGSNDEHKNSFNAYKNTELTIKDISSGVYTADTSNLSSTTVFHAQGGTLNIGTETVPVGDITLKNVANGFMSQNGGSLYVNAGDVTVNAINGNALQCSYNKEDSSIDINANNLTLTSTVAAGISSMGGDVDIDVVNAINITGSNGVNANYGGSVSLDAQNITITNNGSYNAVRAANGGSVSVNATTGAVINGDVFAEGNNSVVTIDGGASTTINGTVFADSDEVHNGKNNKVSVVESITVNLKGDSITINANEYEGVFARGNYTPSADNVVINVGEASTQQININDAYIGLWADYNGSEINVQGKKLYIKSTIGEEAYAGIVAMNGTEPQQWGVEGADYVGSDGCNYKQSDEALKDVAHIVISEDTVTTIDMRDENEQLASTAIVALSEGIVDIKGDLYASAKESIVVRGGANVNINNEGKNKVVQLTGDIDFNYSENTSGTPIDANVNLNLTNDSSFFTGKIVKTGAPYPEGYDQVKGMKISVTDGAVWNLTGASTVNNATFGKDSVFNIVEGSDFTGDVYALNAGGATNDSLTVEEGAKIVIGNGELNKTYNIAKGFAEGAGENWTLQADNALWYADWEDLDKTDDTLQATIKVKDGEALVESGVATGENQNILSNVAGATEGKNATADAINELASSGASTEDIQKGAAALLQIGEAGGFTGNVVSVGKQVNNVVGGRNSFAGPKHGGPRHRGGHGPSVTEENNGGAIWAQYVHGKDKVDGIDMGGVENAYESQFNGVVLGADFKQVGSYASGIAFNYGEGDSHSKKNVVQSDSEFDFWGVSYYGAVKKQDTNFIFDIGYSESDSDVEQVVGGNTITANPEASTWSAGVKVEKLIDKGAVQIVPYAGLRYMSIDTDEYEAKGSTAGATYYSTERQDIWLLPIGVSLSQENVYDSGWIVTPKADLSYTWAMGDTDSSMTVNMPGVGSDNLGYTVMDDGSFMATIGLDAQKEDWTFGVAYSYQKGDSTRSDRWYVNARYSF